MFLTLIPFENVHNIQYKLDMKSETENQKI